MNRRDFPSERVKAVLPGGPGFPGQRRERERALKMSPERQPQLPAAGPPERGSGAVRILQGLPRKGGEEGAELPLGLASESLLLPRPRLCRPLQICWWPAQSSALVRLTHKVRLGKQRRDGVSPCAA